MQFVLALLLGAALGVGAMFLAPRRPARPPVEHSREASPPPRIDDEAGLAYFIDQWDAPVAELDGQRGRPDAGWTLLGTADSWAEAKRGLHRIAGQTGRPGELRIVVRLPGTTSGGAGFGGYFAEPPRLPAAARAAAPAAPAAPVSLYDQIGGSTGLTAVVKDFYYRMRSDPRFGERFLLVDMAQLMRHQVMLLTVLTGGPNVEGYTVDQLHVWVQRAHVRMGLTHPDFDAMAAHLLGAGSDHGVGDDQLQAIANALEGFRADVVTTAAVARPAF